MKHSSARSKDHSDRRAYRHIDIISIIRDIRYMKYRCKCLIPVPFFAALWGKRPDVLHPRPLNRAHYLGLEALRRD